MTPEPSLPSRRYLPGGAIEFRVIRHLRCPACGLRARLARTVSKSGEVYGFEGGPYSVWAYDQTYGGSPPAGQPGTNRHGREHTKGKIDWAGPMPPSREELETLRASLTSAIESIDEALSQ